MVVEQPQRFRLLPQGTGEVEQPGSPGQHRIPLRVLALEPEGVAGVEVRADRIEGGYDPGPGVPIAAVHHRQFFEVRGDRQRDAAHPRRGVRRREEPEQQITVLAGRDLDLIEEGLHRPSSGSSHPFSARQAASAARATAFRSSSLRASDSRQISAEQNGIEDMDVEWEAFDVLFGDDEEADG